MSPLGIPDTNENRKVFEDIIVVTITYIENTIAFQKMALPYLD